MAEDYVLSGFFVAHFSTLGCLFFPTTDAAFSFSTLRVAGFCSTVPFQTKPSNLPFRAGKQKRSHSFYSRASGKQPPTTPLLVYAGCCYEKHQKYVTQSNNYHLFAHSIG